MIQSVPRPAVPAAPPRAAPAAAASRLAPPFRLPAEHFVAALGCWVVGAMALVWAAPAVSRGWFMDPQVVALTHLFTLGWITLTIQGALYQFLPVALGEPIRWPRLARAALPVHVGGLAVFCVGLVGGDTLLTVAGAAAFSAAMLVFATNLAATLLRSRPTPDAPDAAERRLTWWALAAAAVFLVATVVLGASLSGNLHWGYLGAERFAAVGVHLHIAVAGWVMLVMVGVAHRLLPMFLLSHGAPTWPGAAAAGLLAGGSGLLLAMHRAVTPTLTWAVAGLLIAGALAFLLQAALFFRHRRKPALDPGLRLAATAVLALLAAIGMAPAAIAAGLTAPHVATAYVVMLVLGGLSLFVAGHYYKILPFLVWFHRFGPLAGKRPVPRVADLYAAAPADAAAALLGGGVAALTLATLLRAEWLARPAALLFCAGAIVLTLQMAGILRRRPE